MHTSIRQMAEKIKSFSGIGKRFKDISPETYTHGLIVLIIILTAIASFGLGKLSALRSFKKPIVIENTVFPVVASIESINKVVSSTALSQTAGVVNAIGEVVASRTGDKYHLPTCAGAKSISAKNKITFSSVEEARRAGYLPAGNCKGLK
ncbi:hypothetical protein EPO17_00880 [Patescibacteria group bacterium]|nr:MAG: hypothetical protein EPO17_00880 [Patescibacteria group bacterium]